jgi:hypothetical protein
MGLVASQARLLLLFGRKSDVEFRCQQISNKRMRLSFETGEVAQVYADALSNTAPIVDNIPTTAFSSLIPAQNIVAAPTGQAISLEQLYENNLQPYYENNGLPAYWLSPSEIASGLSNGSLYLRYNNAPAGVDPNTRIASSDILNSMGVTVTTGTTWVTPPDQPASSQTSNRLYTEDDAAATAIYEAQTAILQAEDKRLELELKNLETQHKAISTEVDAVQKVIEKNIEKSFKTLG